MSAAGVIGAMLRSLTESETPRRPDPFQPGHAMEGEDLIPPAFGPWKDRSLYSYRADSSTTSRASLALATLWLNNCLRNHAPCRVLQGDGRLPRRVINISNPDLLYMEDGQDRKADYVTLSYKWGDCKKYNTTSLNLQQHQKEIPFHKLPLTFREAVDVARALGFQWLWIDALCIVQDSDAEKAAEINRMHQIFRSSALTLFAAAGDNADAGLSSRRDPRQAKPCMLELRNTVPLGNNERVDSLVLLKDWHAGLCDKPLYDRAWVLQEEMFASRHLVFSPKLLGFRCFCGTSNEGEPNLTPPFASIQDLSTRNATQFVESLLEIKLRLLQQDHLPPLLPPSRSNFFEDWYDLVWMYTSRSLTSSHDILPALAGLANAFRERHKWTYVLGLWREDLPKGLFWDAERGANNGAKVSEISEEATESSRFPSWSWCSVWGRPVGFFHQTMESDPVLTVQDMQFYDGSDVTSITLPSLKLTGRVRSARIGGGLQENGDPAETTSVAACLHDTTTGDVVGRVHFDTRRDVKPPGPVVYCLLILTRPKPSDYETDRWTLGCLALVPIEGSSEVFRRVGLAYITEEKDGWFEQDDADARLVRSGPSTGQDIIRTITLV